jgi:lactate dehydrogenase-like 2-hydroxyacid dehydrogenase
LKQRLLITRRLPDRVLEAARARFDVTLRDRTEVLSPEELRAALRDYDAVLPTLGRPLPGRCFCGRFRPAAKILANFGVGYNHIDAEAAKAAGIAVTNTPGAVTDATADIALSLILMTARRLGEGERILRAGGGKAGGRCRCWAPMSPENALESSASGGSARRLRSAATTGSTWRWCSTTAPGRGPRPARPAGGDGRGDGGGFRRGGGAGQQGDTSPDRRQGPWE